MQPTQIESRIQIIADKTQKEKKKNKNKNYKDLNEGRKWKKKKTTQQANDYNDPGQAPMCLLFFMKTIILCKPYSFTKQRRKINLIWICLKLTNVGHIESYERQLTAQDRKV